MCSRVDLPVASITRTKYGEYPEYHTSLDNLKDVVTPNGLDGGYWALRNAIQAIEKNKTYKYTILCEPQMGKRGLYPSISTKDSKQQVRKVMDFLSICDGKITLLEAAEELNLPIWSLYEVVDTLLNQNLITEVR